MTDIDGPLGRIDLRSLDAHIASERVDEIVTAAMRRPVERHRHAPTDLLSTVAQHARPLLSAAALLIVLGASIIHHTTEHTTEHSTNQTTAHATDRTSDHATGASVRSLAAWADAWTETRRVPTNGEVLAAFGGYR